jgi:hypothetical protein
MISRLLSCAALVAEETSEMNALIKTMVSQIFTETVANGILITLILAEFMMEVISLLLCYAADVEVDYLMKLLQLPLDLASMMTLSQMHMGTTVSGILKISNPAEHMTTMISQLQ